MISRKSADLPLAVQLPAPEADRPSWVKVGIIAAVGFVVGVGWPRLVGVRLGPSAPAEASGSPTGAAAASARATESAAPLPPSATSLPAGPSPGTAAATAHASAAPALPVAPDLPTVTVGKGIVLSCRTEDGDSLKGVASCGSLGGFDAVVRPRLARLNSCPAAAGAAGKLSVVFNLDFKTNHVGVDVGKSSTVTGADAFGSCLKSAFSAVSLGPIPHDQVKYALVYSAVFAPGAASPTPSPSAPPDGASPPAGSPPPPRSVPPSAPASVASPAEDGSAQVVWEVALVRDAPRTGQIVARLARGTRVRLGAGDDGWYKVQFGAGFSTEGYVYRAAIGK